MKSIKKNSKNSLKKSSDADPLITLKLDDIYALSLLQPLLQGYPVLPITGSSLRPYCLIRLVNDITVNHRTNIIEFGCGMSTIIFGRLLKKNKINATITSIEHDELWLDYMKKLLDREGLMENIKLVYAPLEKCDLSIKSIGWYSTNVLCRELKDKVFDMVIVDGPPAFEFPKAKSRYPALPFIIERVSKNFSIHLDDANRPGEQFILQRWRKQFPAIEFTITGNTLASAYRGISFYTEPFVYPDV